MTVNRQRGSNNRLWAEFARRHKGNPFLELDPLYSIPEPLLDIIAGKQEGSLIERQGVAPGFLSKQDVAFERDLARTVSGGFSFRKPFKCLLLEPAMPPEQAKSDRQIKTLWAEELENEGIHPQRVQDIFAKDAHYQDLADTRAASYAGWLVTNELFRRERDDLRRHLGDYVKKKRRFPVMSQSFLGKTIGRPDGGRAHADYLYFYRRWGLETFLTWDLPVPMRPALHGTTHFDLMESSDAGVSVHLPWYIIRDGRFQLQEMLHHLHNLRNPAHLEGWLKPAPTRKKKLGETRFRNVFILYRYQKLAIENRYSGRDGWDVVRQDVAFGRFMGQRWQSRLGHAPAGDGRKPTQLSEESVKRVRLYLQKHLAS